MRGRIASALVCALAACADATVDLPSMDAGLTTDAGPMPDASAPEDELDAGSLRFDVIRAETCADLSTTLPWPAELDPPRWRVRQGALPQGLTLDEATGEVFGRPIEAGSGRAVVEVQELSRQRITELRFEIEAGRRVDRWALLSEAGATEEVADDRVQLLDVCGVAPGSIVPLLSGAASLAFTGRAIDAQNAFARRTGRVAVHQGTYEPLEIETAIFDLPERGGAPAERLRVPGLFEGFDPPGDRALVTTTTGTRAVDVVVYQIPAEDEPAQELLRFPACPEGCPLAWSPQGRAVATVADALVQVYEGGRRQSVGVGEGVTEVAFASDGASVLGWGTQGGWQIPRSPDGRPGPPARFSAEEVWVAADPARARHPVPAFLRQQDGLRWVSLSDPARTEVLLDVPRPDGARVSLAPTGARVLVLDPAGPTAWLVETDQDPPRTTRLDLSAGGARPLRLPGLEQASLQWRPDGDRVLVAGVYEGCGCTAGQPICPKVAVTLLRTEGGWVVEPEYDVDAAGLEALCTQAGLPALIAAGSVDIAPAGRFFAISRADLALIGPGPDGLAPWLRLFEGTTSFFPRGRWTPDGRAFVSARVFAYVGGPTPGPTFEVPGERVREVVLPPR